MRAALEAMVLGDGSLFDELFHDDVHVISPHLVTRNRSELLTAIGHPESTLIEIDISIQSVTTIADRVTVEWQLDAIFGGALLFDDNILIEPTGDPVRMSGASFAQFRGDRIARMQNYFDDSELLDSVPDVEQSIRMTARWSG